jgi:hypothetical protein
MQIIPNDDKRVDIHSDTMILIPHQYSELQLQALEHLRKQKESGKTYQQIADELGTTKGQVHKWLDPEGPRPIKEPQLSNILRIYLGMDPSKICTLLTAISHKPQVADALIDILQLADDDTKEAIQDIILAAAKNLRK